jgi:hypothetical protein
MHQTSAVEPGKAQHEPILCCSGATILCQFRPPACPLSLQQVRVTQIVQEGDALAVTGSAGGRYLRRTYYAGELRASSQQRRAWRQTAGSPEPEAVREVAPPREPVRPAEAPPASDGGGDLSHLIDAAEGPLLRRMRQAQERPRQD